MSYELGNAKSSQAYRISPTDSNYFVLLFDAEKGGTENVFLVEIFNVAGATPPNTHLRAFEFFYVLEGRGIASCKGVDTPIQKGDALLVRPGSEHVVKNTGSSKLYTLTVMTPDEEFAALIRSGEPVDLDGDDMRVLGAMP